jgi:hypothetical protein
VSATPFIDHVEEHVGRIGAVPEIGELVDCEDSPGLPAKISERPSVTKSAIGAEPSMWSPNCD